MSKEYIMKKRSRSARKKNKGQRPQETGPREQYLHGFKLKEMDYVVPPMGERKKRRSAFSEVRKEFLAHIGKNCVKELQALGMSASQIKQIEGGNCPNGFNVHHKLPIHGGGKNEFPNLILMPIPQHDDLHHKILDPQVSNMQGGSKKVQVPWSDNMVFVRPEKSNANAAALALASVKNKGR